MKKYSIPIIMVIIVLLLIISIIITKDKTVSSNFYDGTYTRITKNYINDKEYSKTTEIISIAENKWIYKKIIKYEDYQKEDISVYVSGTYENKHFNLNSGEDVYVEKNRICFDKDKKECLTSKETNKENYINDFEYSDYLITIKSLDEITDDFAIVVFVRQDSTDSITYKKILIDTLYDHDIKYYLLDLTKATKDELKYWNNYYQVETFPVTYIMEKGKITDYYTGAQTKEKVSQILLEHGIKSR